MPVIRAFAVLLLLLSALTASPVARATAEPSGESSPITVSDIADLLTYEVQTTANRSGSPVTRSTPGLVAVPTLVDVDGSPIPLPDLLVEVVALPPGILAITIQRTTPGLLPLRVELQFDLPGASDPAVSFGYDALEGSAPTTFVTRVSVLRGLAGNTTVDANVTHLTTAPDLALVGSVFDKGPDGPTDAMDFGVDLAPSPGSLTAHLESDPTAGRTMVRLRSSKPTEVTVDVTDEKDGRSRTLHAVVADLPRSVSLEARDGVDGSQVTYLASAPISSIGAKVDETLDGGDERHAVLEVTDVPTRIDVTRDAADHVSMTADGPVGSIEGGFAEGRAVALLDETGHYLNAETGEDGSSTVAARVVGLRSFDAELGDPVAVTATLESAPLHARIVDPARAVDVHTSPVPATVAVRFSPTVGFAEYDASSQLDRFHVTVDSDVPFLQQADHGELTVTTLPPHLRLDFGRREPAPEISPRRVCVPDQTTECPDPDPPLPPDDDEEEPPPPPPVGEDSDDLYVFDANGESIGSIDALLTSDGLPDDALNEEEDGLVLDQSGGEFRLQARISGLRQLSAHLVTIDRRPAIDLITNQTTVESHLDPAVVQERSARATIRVDGGFATATLDHLPTDIDTLDIFDSLRPAALGRRQETLQQVVYNASSPVDITVDADLPGMPNPLHAEITDAPKEFEFCKATDGACNDEPGTSLPRDKGSFLFHSDRPVTLNAFLCLTPATGSCTTEAAATSALSITDLKLQHVAYELNVGTPAELLPDNVPPNPFRLLLDTAGFPVSGRLNVFDAKAKADVRFPGNSFVGNESESVGLDVKNMPALRTIEPWQLTFFRSGTLTLAKKVEGRFDCQPATTWTVVLPTAFLPNQDITDLIC